MPNLAAVLKDEIRRLARKEIRTELSAAKKASTQYRRDIAALKRENKAQARKIAALETDLRRVAEKQPVRNGADGQVRFSPKWLRAHREKLALSAADYAELVGVSGLTIYNWEKGKTKPRAQQLAQWAEVRGLGKREAWRKLGIE
jgi:DNA-binding transcriptional regulator YiaG